jgi:hypothetical protein
MEDVVAVHLRGIDLIRDDPQVMALGDIANGNVLGAGEHGARGVGGRIEQDRLCL